MSIAVRVSALSAPDQQPGAKGKRMNQAKKAVVDDEMLPEYDFSGGVRGKYYRRYQEGTNIVVLAPDVADAFPNADAVNEALRLLVKLARERAHPARKPARRKKRRHNSPMQPTGSARG
jgi:hypothetical protein